MPNGSERTTLLESIGFTVLGELVDVGGVTPEKAWRSAINLAVKPDVAVDSAGEEALSRAEAAWRTYGSEIGLFAADGSFCISVSGPGAFTLPWVLVRGAQSSGFLTAMSARSGRTDFVAISPDGAPVMALTEEEHEYWLVEVDLLD
ncbi:MAG: hypothetical protein ACRDQ7_06955 [Haloechinothrix sp.]